MSDKNVSEQPWITSDLHGNEEVRIRWVPVVQLPSGVVAGITDGSEWVVQRPDGSVVANLRHDPLPLLSCVELPRDDFVQALKSGLERRSLSADIVDSFPVDAIVELGYSSRRVLRQLVPFRASPAFHTKPYFTQTRFPCSTNSFNGEPFTQKTK